MSKNLTIFDFKLLQMPTYLKTGIYQPPLSKVEEEAEQAVVYIDEKVIQMLDDKDELIIQFTYEELRGNNGCNGRRAREVTFVYTG